ncbi:MAG: FHA domain-containing protein, partial [Candidatus Binatia bacterium]
MATSIKITILEGSRPGEATMFEGDRLTIGRAASCDLVLEDQSISRTHAAIEREGEAFVLVDLGSNNGTFVEGQKARITRHRLKNGDQITLGKSRLQVEVPEVAAPAPKADLEATMVGRRPIPTPTPPKPAPDTPAEKAAAGKATAETKSPAPGIVAQQPSDLPIVLTVVAGADRGQVYMPNTDHAIIGRLSTSDIPLNDPAVSRVHASIKRERGGYWLYDENSRFGTEVGGVKILHRELRSGELIRVGETELRVEIGAGKGAAAEGAAPTLLSANIGERTFAISLKSLGSARAPSRPPG